MHHDTNIVKNLYTVGTAASFSGLHVKKIKWQILHANTDIKFNEETNIWQRQHKHKESSKGENLKDKIWNSELQ